MPNSHQFIAGVGIQLVGILTEITAGETQDVKGTMLQFGFPGIKLLIFDFDGDVSQNPYAPDNHVKNCILYTGTHDYNKVRGWFEEEFEDEAKVQLEDIRGKKLNANTVAEAMMVFTMRSITDTVILLMQYVLGLGSEAHINCLGIAENNWESRLLPGEWSNSDAEKIAAMTKTYGRESVG
jgi:4-alpha-glucanotransferase